MQHGDFVEYCMPNGEYRPALVVRAWSEHCAQLQVFTDKVNDGPDPHEQDWFRSSCSLGTAPGTWRPLPSMFRFVPAPAAIPWFPSFPPVPPTFPPGPPTIFGDLGSATAAPAGTFMVQG